MFAGKSLIVLGAVGLGLATPTATAASTTSLHLTARATQGGIVGPGNSQRHLGAMQIGSGSLLGAGGRVVGTFAFTCLTVRVHRGYVDEQCTSWGSLSGGQLILAGKSRSDTNRHSWAVTGGTGAYRDVRGEARLLDVNDHDTVVDVTLVPAAR